MPLACVLLGSKRGFFPSESEFVVVQLSLNVSSFPGANSAPSNACRLPPIWTHCNAPSATFPHNLRISSALATEQSGCVLRTLNTLIDEVIPLPCCELIKTCHQFRFRNCSSRKFVQQRSPTQSHPMPAWLPIERSHKNLDTDRIKDPRRLKTSSKSQSSNATKPLLITAIECRTGGTCHRWQLPKLVISTGSGTTKPRIRMRKQTVSKPSTSSSR